MLKQVLLMTFFLLPGGVSSAFAHAVTGTNLSSSDTKVVEFVYSTGDKAAYVAVDVFSPTDQKIEFQNGRTDALGRFAFTPDTPGIWTVVLADGMGHKVSHTVDVTAVASASSTASGAPVASGVPDVSASGLASQSLLFRGLLGVSILVNLFLGAALFRRRS